jgi:hypothetical protein
LLATFRGRSGIREKGISSAKDRYLRNTVTTTSTVTSFRFGADSQHPAVWTVRLS